MIEIDPAQEYTVMFNPGPDWFASQAALIPPQKPGPNSYPDVCRRGFSSAFAAQEFIRRQRGLDADPEYYIVPSDLPDSQKRNPKWWKTSPAEGQS